MRKLCTPFKLVFLTLLVTASHTALSQTSADDDIVVTVLGSGTPVPSRTQAGTAILVQAGGQQLMFDCGRACSMRLAELDPKLNGKVDRLFLTHLHSDHVTGIPDLWLNGWTDARRTPMKVIGPAGTVSMMEGLRKAFEYDVKVRVADGVPPTTNGLAADFHDLEAKNDQIVYRQEDVTVTAFLVEHATVDPAYGYRIDYKDKSVLISGDTARSENVIKFGEGVDVLLHEVMSPALINILKTMASPEQLATVVAAHTTADQTAEIFNITKPRLAIYYHTRNDGPFAASLENVTRNTYAGPMAISHDLFQIHVSEEITILDKRLK